MEHGVAATSSRRSRPIANEGSWGAKRQAAAKHRLRPTERALVGLEGFTSVCGLAGGAYMASHPLTTMSTTYLDGTWFHTWRWPGLALFFFVGVCPALVVGATCLRLGVATVGHLCVGVGLVAWILLEAAWVVVSPLLQVVVGVIGMIILVLAVREARRPADGAGNG